MLSFLIAVSMHSFWIEKFLSHGIIAIALACIITNVLTFALIKGFILTQKDLKQAEIPICEKRTLDLGFYWSLAMPFMIVILLENWVWEQMTLASGLVGIDEQAFQVILINLLTLNYMIGSGMQSSASTVVGNQIGYGNTKKAIEYFQVTIITGLILFGV
jgi:Na+-driven multidrug efflux pump